MPKRYRNHIEDVAYATQQLTYAEMLELAEQFVQMTADDTGREFAKDNPHDWASALADFAEATIDNYTETCNTEE